MSYLRMCITPNRPNTLHTPQLYRQAQHNNQQRLLKALAASKLYFAGLVFCGAHGETSAFPQTAVGFRDAGQREHCHRATFARFEGTLALSRSSGSGREARAAAAVCWQAASSACACCAASLWLTCAASSSSDSAIHRAAASACRASRCCCRDLHATHVPVKLSNWSQKAKQQTAQQCFPRTEHHLADG